MVSIDANRQLVILLRYWTLRNESLHTWTKTGSLLIEGHGDRLNNSETVIMSDRMKGLQVGLHASLPLAKSWACVQHLKKNVMLQCGAAMGCVFEALVYAATEAEFEFHWAKGTSKFHAYISKIPRSEYAKFYCPAALRGRTASQVIFKFFFVPSFLI